MCQTTAYVVEDGREVLLLKDVVMVRPEGTRVRITSLFGDEMVVEGRITHVDLLVHKIVIAH